MIFNSHIFLFVFLPLTWIIFQAVGAFRRPRIALGMLMAASLFFYAYWNPYYLALIVTSILVNFSLGKYIAREKKRWALVSGTAINLATIAYL